MSDVSTTKYFAAKQKLVSKIEDRVSGPIWHYTDAQGFRGIIESNEIWMTNARFVNDKTELRASFEGREIFRDVTFENSDFDRFKSKSREVKYGDDYEWHEDKR